MADSIGGIEPATGKVAKQSEQSFHLLGFDHERLTFRHAGRDFRLTNVKGEVVKAILA
jgi:hypothetical protein